MTISDKKYIDTHKLHEQDSDFIAFANNYY